MFAIEDISREAYLQLSLFPDVPGDQTTALGPMLGETHPRAARAYAATSVFAAGSPRRGIRISM
jgi:hypothetical protein